MYCLGLMLMPFILMSAFVPLNFLATIFLFIIIVINTLILLTFEEYEEFLIIPSSEHYQNKDDIYKLISILLKEEGFQCTSMYPKPKGFTFTIYLKSKKMCDISIHRRFNDYLIVIIGKLKSPSVIKVKNVINRKMSGIFSKRNNDMKINNNGKSIGSEKCFICGKSPRRFQGGRLVCCKELVCGDCVKPWKKGTYEKNGKCMICDVLVYSTIITNSK